MTHSLVVLAGLVWGGGGGKTGEDRVLNLSSWVFFLPDDGWQVTMLVWWEEMFVWGENEVSKSSGPPECWQ